MTAIDIMPFVREHNQAWSGWADKTLYKHLNWFLHHDLCQIVLDKEEIIAIGLARPINESTEHYELDREGDSIFVDFVCVRSDLAKAWLYSGILEKIGMKKNIIFRRPKQGKLLKQYDCEKFMNKFTKGIKSNG